MRRPNDTGRIIAAVAVSLAAHALLLTRHVDPPQLPARPPAVDVVLDYRPPSPAEPPPEIVEDEPEDGAQPAADPAVSPPRPPPPKMPPDDRTVEPDETLDAPTRLNLERPDDWDEIVAPPPDGRTHSR